MAHAPTTLDDAYNAAAGTVDTFSLHTGDPGTTGASEVAGGLYTRVARDYADPASGAGDLTAPAVFEVPAGTVLTHWGAWAGTEFRFGGQLGGDAEDRTFTEAGQFTLASAPYQVSEAPSA